MDRPLDEIVTDRQRGGNRGRRNGRTDSYPRDGVRKPNQRTSGRNLDSDDWVHDRFEENGRRSAEPRERTIDRYRSDYDSRPSASSARLRVDNLHYELTEPDLRELFTRIGPILTCQILYDKADRSRGTAFVTYHNRSDALTAVKEFDGANAYGQPIRVTLLPTGPSRDRGGDLFDRTTRPRSLFDRVSEPAPRRRRSESPESRRNAARKAPPEYIDRYVPDENSNRRDTSSTQRRGGGGGRRPGARREDSGRRDRRRDDDGRPLVGGRPRKTAEELDAEMSDYWGSGAAGTSEQKPVNAVEVAADDDIDMIE